LTILIMYFHVIRNLWFILIFTCWGWPNRSQNVYQFTLLMNKFLMVFTIKLWLSYNILWLFTLVIYFFFQFYVIFKNKTIKNLNNVKIMFLYFYFLAFHIITNVSFTDIQEIYQQDRNERQDFIIVFRHDKRLNWKAE